MALLTALFVLVRASMLTANVDHVCLKHNAAVGLNSQVSQVSPDRQEPLERPVHSVILEVEESRVPLE